jgi:hypothetical protein
LRHEHHIALHFPAHLHVDTRLAVSFTVRFFWQASIWEIFNSKLGSIEFNLIYWFYLRDIKQIIFFSCFSFFQSFISVGSKILLVQIWISWFVLVDNGILIYTDLNPVQIRIPICTVRFTFTWVNVCYS